VIDNRRPFRAASSAGGVAAIVCFARTLCALAAQARRPGERYWVLKGQRRDFYICARPGCHRCTALCVFDSERAARKPLSILDKPRMFLSTLEFYGASMPSWVREEPLLPRIRGRVTVRVTSRNPNLLRKQGRRAAGPYSCESSGT
jgi:hypothetical protein